MTANPVRTAAAAESGLVSGTLLEALVKRNGYVLDVGESLGDVDFDVGEPPRAVLDANTGATFYYDSTDTTTPNDGVTCLVSGDGRRYHLEAASAISISSVLDVVTAPTGSESIGDAYIVDAAATDEFDGRDGTIALLTRRGWVFADPGLGQTVWNEASGTNWQFTSSGWGGFTPELGDGAVAMAALEQPAGVVVEATLNAPPGSPSAGQFFIVGTSPTGDFSGHDAELARWDGVAWSFLEPAEGWTVWNKALIAQQTYQSGVWSGTIVGFARGVLYGLRLSNNAVDVTNDLDVAAGAAVDSTGAVVIRLTSSITKRLDAAWAVGSGNGGRDTGSISDATWHVWLILRSDTGVVDVLLSTSASSPTMPANYDFKARIGSIVRTSSAIKKFFQEGDWFYWDAQAADVADANPGTSAQTKTLTVPTGIRVIAVVNASWSDLDSPGSNFYLLVTALDQTDTAPSASAWTSWMNNSTGGKYVGTVQVRVRTNTSGQIRYRMSQSDANVSVVIQTVGWLDTRGREG